MHRPRTFALAASAVVALAPAVVAPTADATTVSTYRHGVWAQGHWATQALCDSQRTRALSSISSYKGKNVRAGVCHRIDAGAGKSRQSGWLFDVRYDRTGPIWSTDSKLGKAPAAQRAGAHSFKVNGYYATKSEAVTIEAARVKTLEAASFGAKVTWRSGVKQNAITKRWEYEIDYDSRVPMYYGHVELSQRAGVTTPSLGVTQPIPTNVTPDAKDDSTTVITPPPSDVTPSVPEKVGLSGIDISGHTVVEDWAGWKSAGVDFLYTKASEGDYYTNPRFAAQYIGAYKAGIVRGAYHFANPSQSTGAQQADYFLAHGGGWSPDGKTMPGSLDIEWNPYGDACFNLTNEQMGQWISDFVTEYKARTGVAPVIYTAPLWWNKCVGTSYAPDANGVPLWTARPGTTGAGALPLGWAKHMIWQNAWLDRLGYDTDIFNGTLTQLKAYASTGRF